MQSTGYSPTQSRIWWWNGIAFLSVHIASALGVFYYPPHAVPRATLLLMILLFQSAEISITVGYHRLYSHRAFRASFPVRIVVALLGASAMQGSIKWWCLRHRLHHRYTDDPVHDPYCATRGLLWSHMGWIFFKPHYERLKLIDTTDLEIDPVVRLQHKLYVPLAVSLGLLLPPCIGALWGDAAGAFVWAALVARLLIWHCTFFVNSLAHWDGLQPYSDENTSKSNLLLALLTCGEGNHNFHAFPHDYRSGPARFDWDPSKWTILLLNKIGLVWGLKRARAEDVSEALQYMQHKHEHGDSTQTSNVKTEEGTDHPRKTLWEEESEAPDGSGWQSWTLAEVKKYVAEKPGRCVVVLDGFVVDVTAYLAEHPGGAALLRRYSVRIHDEEESNWKQASWAFHEGLNVHSRAARKRMCDLRIGRFANE